MSTDVILVESVVLKLIWPNAAVSLEVILVVSEPTMYPVITSELDSLDEIFVVSLEEIFVPPETCISAVSEDEIIVESEPGKLATGEAVSVEVICVESVVEKFIWPNAEESVVVISVVSDVLTVPADAEVSDDVISVVSAPTTYCVMASELLSVVVIFVESEADVSTPPLVCTFDVSEELISVESDPGLLIKMELVSVELTLVISVLEKLICPKLLESVPVISVVSVLVKLT